MLSRNIDLHSSSSRGVSAVNGNAQSMPLEREGENYLDTILRKEIHQWFKLNNSPENQSVIKEPDNFRALGVITLGYNDQ